MKQLSAIIFSMLLIFASSALNVKAESFMDKYLDNFNGMHIDEVIEIKGKPASERSFAGKKIYIWEYSKTIFNSIDKSTELRKNRAGELYINNPSPDDEPKTYYCKIIIETDELNYVKSAKWTGDICSSAIYSDKNKIKSPQP